MLLGACSTYEDNNNINKNTELEKKNNSQSAQISFDKLTEVSVKELTQLLHLKKSEIMKIVGNQNESGTMSIMESHMIFPFIFSKQLGLTFIFPNEIDDFNPIYIYINKETNVKNVGVKGAKPGMSFKEIVDKLGEGQIEQTWVSNEDNLIYKLDIQIDGIVYRFVSYDETGEDSQLYICLDE